MSAYITPLLDFSYWFSYYPPEPFSGSYYWIVAGAVLGAITLGVAAKLLARVFSEPSTKAIVRKLSSLLMVFGVLCGISLFFTQTNTPLFGARAWFLLWLVGALVWLGSIAAYAVLRAPKERRERAKQQELARYLPKRAD